LKLLVTGPGKLGARLLRQLARQGVTGRVLHRRAALDLPAGWESRRADLTDPRSLTGVCAGCDAILHLAALTHTNEPQRYERVNAAGTGSLLAEARQAGVRRFIHVSSRAIDPNGGAYSRSKIHAEALVREAGIPWTILRPGEIYGAGGEGLSAVIERARAGRWIPIVGDGGYLLAPVFVDDVVDGLCAAVRTPAAGRLFHVAGPEEITYLRLVERLAAHFGTRPVRVRVPGALLHGAARLLAFLPLRHPPLYADQIPRLLSPKPYEITAAAAELGWKPRRLEEGLASLTATRSGGSGGGAIPPWRRHLI
jgi:nucleoside-diphosphate-sugar epimerase